MSQEILVNIALDESEENFVSAVVFSDNWQISQIALEVAMAKIQRQDLMKSPNFFSREEIFSTDDLFFIREWITIHSKRGNSLKMVYVSATEVVAAIRNTEIRYRKENWLVRLFRKIFPF